MKQWMKEKGDQLKMNKKKIGILCAIVVALCVITCLIELLVFNYQPLFHPNETIKLDLTKETENDQIFMYEGMSKDVQAEIEADTRNYRIDEEAAMEDIVNARENYNAVCFELENPAYYKKFRINFNSKNNVTYYLDINYINEYGEKETCYTSDRLYNILKYGVTNINKKISSITVYLPTYFKGEIKSVELTDLVKWNKYRMVCVFSCLAILLMLILGKKIFTEKLEILVLVWGFLFGICFLMSQGINENSWDEHVHFDSVFQLASGDTYVKNDTVERMQKRIQKLLYTTNEEKYATTNYYNEKFKEVDEVVESRRFSYRDVLYLPQIITTKMALAFDWSFETLCMVAKGISLIIYVFFLYWIVKNAKVYKFLFAIIGLMPINVFIAAAFSYNMFTLIFHLAGFMIWLNIMSDDQYVVKIKDLLLMLIFFALGSLSKPMYIVMALLIFLIPGHKYKDARIKKYLLIGVLAAVVVVFLFLGIPLVKTLLAGGSMPGDSRGGNTDIVVQLSHVLKHPFTYIKIMIRDICDTAVWYLLNTESYLKFGRFYALEGNFPIYISVLMLGVTFLSHKDSVREFKLEKKYRIGLFITIMILVVAVWTSMYLVFTPQGRTSIITGVQGRYYAPLLIPLMACLRNNKIVWDVKETTYNKCFLGLLAGLTMYIVYFEMMEPFCF